MDAEKIVKIKISFWDGFFKTPNTNGEIILTKEYAECETTTMFENGNSSKLHEKINSKDNRHVLKAFKSLTLVLDRNFKKEKVCDASGFAIKFIDSEKHSTEKFFNFSFRGNRLAMQGNALMKLFEFMIARCDVFKSLNRSIVRKRKPRKPDLRKITNNGQITKFRIDHCGLVYRLNGLIAESFDFKTREWHSSDSAQYEFYMGTDSYSATPLEVYKQIKQIEQQIKDRKHQ